MKISTMNDVFSDMVGIWGDGQVILLILAGFTQWAPIMWFYFVWAIGFPILWGTSPDWFVNIMAFIFKKLYRIK